MSATEVGPNDLRAIPQGCWNELKMTDCHFDRVPLLRLLCVTATLALPASSAQLRAMVGTQVHRRALAAGLKALEEADIFVPGGSLLQIDSDLTRPITVHQIPVLKDAHLRWRAASRLQGASQSGPNKRDTTDRTPKRQQNRHRESNGSTSNGPGSGPQELPGRQFESFQRIAPFFRTGRRSELDTEGNQF